MAKVLVSAAFMVMVLSFASTAFSGILGKWFLVCPLLMGVKHSQLPHPWRWSVFYYKLTLSQYVLGETTWT
jgi:hypothetical protein